MDGLLDRAVEDEVMTVTEDVTFLPVANSATGEQRIFIYGINYTPEPTGVGRYTGEIASYLAQQGVKVDVVTAVPHYPGWAVRDGYRNCYSVERVGNVNIVRCPLYLKEKMKGVSRLIAPLTFAVTSAPIALWRILRTRPHTVLCIEPTLSCAPVALLAAKIVGARTVLHVQDLEVDMAFAVGHLQALPIKKIAQLFERIVLRMFHTIVTISDRMKERLASKGIDQNRIHVVRNWVNLQQIKPLDRPSKYRRELGLSDNDFVALYAGNIGPKQALPIIIKAAERLASEPNLVFIIVGDGPEKIKLIERCRHLPNVRFLPVQPDDYLCDLLNLANVHLLPQDERAADLVLPSKLGGMLASGRPCIVMADPGTELSDFLAGSVTVLPTGSSSQLATELRRLMRGETSFGVEKRLSLAEAFSADRNLRIFAETLSFSKRLNSN